MRVTCLCLSFFNFARLIIYKCVRLFSVFLFMIASPNEKPNCKAVAGMGRRTLQYSVMERLDLSIYKRCNGRFVFQRFLQHV